MKKLLFSGAAWLGLLMPALLHAASEGAEHHGPGMAVVYHAINFSVLVGLLVFFLRKPAKEFFASRATLIRSNIEEARERKAGAAQKYAEFEGRLKSIEQEMQAIIADLKRDGELEGKRLIEAAQQQMETLKSNSQRMLDQELRKAKEELKREAVILAGSLAEDLIRKNLTPEDQNRIVGQYLEKMEKLG